MRAIARFLRRVAVLGLGILSIWLIVDVFELTDDRVPTLLALGITYGIAAYIILPRAVRMGLKILQRKHVPRFTVTGDGLLGDPVNLALVGTLEQLRAGFSASGWVEAEPLNIKTSWRMAQAFVLNRPYPTAPFSTLYLFGRGHDIGFQKAIGNSPRKRHQCPLLGAGRGNRAGECKHTRLLAQHRPSSRFPTRPLGGRRNTRYRLLANAAYVPGHAWN